MELDTIKKLKQINFEFYEKVSKYFDNSRQYYWDGWEKLLPYIKSSKDVLDVGCGNGRFGSFLFENLSQNFQYTGIDGSKSLLNEAQKRIPNARFIENDVTKFKLEQKYDLVVCFAVLHHIPSFNERLKFLKKLQERSTDRLILSLWNFKDLNLFKNKGDWKDVGINENDLEDGDYLLPWDRGEHAYRYCHLFSDEEIDRYIKELELNKVDDFLADGKNNQTNRYIVFKK